MNSDHDHQNLLEHLLNRSVRKSSCTPDHPRLRPREDRQGLCQRVEELRSVAGAAAQRDGAAGVDACLTDDGDQTEKALQRIFGCPGKIQGRRPKPPTFQLGFVEGRALVLKRVSWCPAPKDF